jgi:hypothetical protein
MGCYLMDASIIHGIDVGSREEGVELNFGKKQIKTNHG